MLIPVDSNFGSGNSPNRHLQEGRWRFGETPLPISGVILKEVKNLLCTELCYIIPMRYLVKARVKKGKEDALLKAIESKTLGLGSIAGDEYIHNMQHARLSNDGTATWVEVCYCNIPLEEERPYWEEYFDLISVEDAHSRQNCRHENGTEAWACSECDCTHKLEESLSKQGSNFLEFLGKPNSP